MKLIYLLIFVIVWLTCLAVNAYASDSTRDELQKTIRDVQQREAKRAAIRLYRARVAKVRGYLATNHSPLTDNAESFIRCGDTYGIKPSLLVGITKAESTFGLHYQLLNNPFNWNVHNGRTFGSMEEGICHVAKGLKENYDTSSVYSIANRYAPSSDGNSPIHWASVVEGVIKDLGV